MRHLIACIALLLLAPLASAGPVNSKHVPADAKWYLHLDLEAAKETALFNQVLDAVKLQFPIEEVVAQLKAGIGGKPLTDTTAVTVYNHSFEHDVAAVVIYAQIE